MPPKEGSLRRHPPLRCVPRAGASSIVFGLSIAIEAAAVAGSKTARRSDMANIGSFKKVGNSVRRHLDRPSALFTWPLVRYAVPG